MEKKKHAALFNGLGGFQIAADQVGWENVFSSEIDGFCNKVTGYHFPKCNQYGDIKTTDFNVWRGQIDVLSGGFPCQPYSHAGKRLGKDDDRYLWPETVRVIREIQPRVIVLENVAGLVSILEPESISKVETEALRLFSEGDQKEQTIKSVESVERRVIATVIEEIEAEGYLLPKLSDGTPIILCIPACAVNAPHRRDRIWFVAFHPEFATDGRYNTRTCDGARMDLGGGMLVQAGRDESSDYTQSSDTDGAYPIAGSKRCNDWSDNRQERYIQTNIGASQEDKSEREGWERWVGKAGTIITDACNIYSPVSIQQWRQIQEAYINANRKSESRDAANSTGIGHRIGADNTNIGSGNSKPGEQEGANLWSKFIGLSRKKSASDALGVGMEGHGSTGQQVSQPRAGEGLFMRNRGIDWTNFPTQSPVCSGDDGLPTKLDGITFSKWRNESIKGFGNAIVPKVALEMFKVIDEML